MLDEQRIEGDPVLPGDDLPESLLGLLGGPGSDDAEPVRDPMDVGVDGDRGDPVTEDENAVRGLRADAGQRRELGVRVRHATAESAEEFGGAGADHARLGMVETGFSDQRLDRGRPGPGEGRGVRVAGEQPRARDVGRRVPRPLREDRPDQHLERVLGVVAEVRRSPVAGPVEGREPVEDRLPVERRGLGHGRFRRARGAGRGSSSGGRPPVPGSERSGSSLAPCVARRSSPIR